MRPGLSFAVVVFLDSFFVETANKILDRFVYISSDWAFVYFQSREDFLYAVWFVL